VVAVEPRFGGDAAGRAGIVYVIVQTQLARGEAAADEE
jgi:hypothetical protein